MVMRVLPRPISSARMPLRFFSCIDTSQSRATCWYSRSVPRMMCGTLTRTFAVDSVAPVGISSFAVASDPHPRWRSEWTVSGPSLTVQP